LETAISLNNIGSCYFSLNDHNRSLEFLRNAVAINKAVQHSSKDVYWKIYIDFWLGTEYIYVNKFDSAELYINRAYTEAFDPGFTDLYSLRPTIFMFYGFLCLKEKKFDSAYHYLTQAISIYDAYKDVFGGADAYTYMAMVFKEQNKPDSVIYYAKKGLDLSLNDNNNYKSSTLNNSRLLAEQYEHSKPALALKYLKIQLETNDSLYGARKIQDLQKTLAEVQQQEQESREKQIEKQNKQKQNAFLVGLGVLLVIAFILYRNNLQRKKANVLLQHQKEKVETTLSDLKATQAQLIQSEKMASLGELTAGIAHEIQNPLNFVNNFSEVNRELIEELKIKNEKLKIEDEEVNELLKDIKDNEEKINHHGKRADAIVKGMLQHSRISSGQKEPTEINALCDEYLRLAYHGLRAKDKSFNAKIETDFDPAVGSINIVPQDIGRVVLNLINNAFYAVGERQKPARAGTDGVEGIGYEPLVIISTKKLNDNLEIKIKDNGNGIPKNILDKIFQPFFTTKPTGQGTGLGLSLAYDIVKAHGGEIKVVSKEGEGSEFIIQLPCTA
jgi:signal transduction histidine kinase